MVKLNEITGERSLDVLAGLVDPIANIAEDKDAAELFGKKDLPADMTVKEYVVKRMRKAIPALLKNHKTDIVRIFSLLSDMTDEEYTEQLTLEGLIIDVSSLVTDALFNAFFTSVQSTDA